MRPVLEPLLVLELVLLAGCTRPPATNEPVPVGRDSVGRFVDVSAGEECPHGGQRFEAGVDADGDGKLSDDEAQTSAVFCHGAPGATPAPDLMRLVPGVLEACGDLPGVLVEIGRDADGDLALDDEEVRDSGALCDGAAGAGGGQALVDVRDATTCAGGGQEVRVGLDGDADGTLADDEVLTSRAVCDGASRDDAGPAGEDGAPSLVEVVAEEVECDAGGQRVRIGRDADGDLTLDAEEVSESVVLCHGVAGQAGAPGPGSGTSEGASDAPVAVNVSRFGDVVGAHVGSVAGNGRSYYAFTSRGDHGPMPYTIALHEAESSLVVTVTEQAAPAVPIDVSCTNEPRMGVVVRVCGTAPLAPATDYVVTVREPANVPNVYLLTVSPGAAQGTAVSPIDVDAGALDTSDVVTRAAVREEGTSHYRFTPPAPDHTTLSIEGLDAPDGDPGLVVTLYDGEVRGDRLMWSCDAFPCVTRALPAGAPVIVVVTGTVPRGAAFDLRLSAGDDVTPVLPLGALTPAAPIMQLLTDASGGYSIYLAGGGYVVAEDPDDEVPLYECAGHGNDVCFFELEGGRRWYLFSRVSTENRDAFAQPSAGQEGSLEAPIALTLDEPRMCSTAHETYGDNGSVPTPSYYTFTTTSAGIHSLDVAGEQPTLYIDDLELHADPLFGSPVPLEITRYGATSRGYVTAPLAAGASYFLVFPAYDALTFSLTAATGDIVTPTLPLDGTMAATTVSGLDYTWFRFSLDELSVVELNATGVDGSLTFRTVLDEPGGPTFQQASRSSDGAVSMVLPAAAYYLQLLTIGTQQIELGASVVSPAELTVGAGFRRDGLLGGASDWYRFVSAVEGVHQLSISFDTSDGGDNSASIAVYDGDGEELVDLTVLNTGVISLEDATTPLPPGPYLVRVRNGNGTFIDYDLQVDAP